MLRIEEEIWCSFSDNLEEIYWRSFTTRWSKQNHEGSTGNSICLNTGPAGTISLKPPRILKDSKNLLFVLTWEGCTYNVAQRMDTQSARHISISNYYIWINYQVSRTISKLSSIWFQDQGASRCTRELIFGI